MEIPFLFWNHLNINKYILHVLSIKLRYKLYFSFSIPTPGFPHFYYLLGANLGLLLYEEVSVMTRSPHVKIKTNEMAFLTIIQMVLPFNEE